MTGKIIGWDCTAASGWKPHWNPAVQPFLYDHQINGTPVLPGVMGIEAMAEAARLLYADRHITAIESVDFHSPFKFYRSQPRTVILRATLRWKATYRRRLPADRFRVLHGQTEPEVTTHFKSRVRLATETSRPAKQKALPKPADGNIVQASDIYRLYFHGPAYQVVESSCVPVPTLSACMPQVCRPNHEPGSLTTLVSHV